MKGKRTLASLLAVSMLVGMLSFNVSANNDEYDVDSVVSETDSFEIEPEDPDYIESLSQEFIEPELQIRQITPIIEDDYEDDIDTQLITASSAADTAEVSDSRELEAAINSGYEYIKIVSDFEIDRTFYITGKTVIYSDGDHTMTRADDFAGDIFVVGENAEGKASILNNNAPRLYLGYPDAEKSGTLMIDGNKENMTVDVVGTVIFLCNSSIVNVYDGIVITNCKKVGNEKTLNSAYNLSYEENIGGAAAIVANGLLSIHGGSFTNNETNDEYTDADTGESTRTSSMGGAIFNFSNVKIYGGTFEGNKAARGAVLYNYRMAKIYSGSFKNNSASKYGGAIYLANSQYSEIFVGDENEASSDEVLFESNTAKNSGGAIHLQVKNAVVVYGHTSFINNKALNNNGGAINSGGTLTVKNTVFSGNTACSKGGAVYAVNSDDELTTRIQEFDNVQFTENNASRGGAFAMMASEDTFSEGAIANFNNCTFNANSTSILAEDETDPNGGAIYLSRKSVLTVNDSVFSNNSSPSEAGAIYATGESTVNISGTEFNSNSILAGNEGNGGALGIHSVKLNVNDSVFNGNTSTKNAGAIYISYSSSSDTNSEVNITDSEFKANESGNYGGAVYVTMHEVSNPKIVLKAKGTSFEENTASGNGGAVYFTGASGYLRNVEFIKNHSDSSSYGGGAIYSTGGDIEIDSARFTENTSAYNGGAIALYSSSKLTANDITASGNNASSYGGFIYTNKSETNMYNSSLSGNSAKNGGALALYTSAVSNIYNTAFDANTASSNGGAVYVYTGATNSLIRNSEFTNNTAGSYGGAVYISNASILDMYSNTAKKNSAKNGGVLYETTTATNVTVNGLTVSGNTATSGPIIYGNTAKAILNINKNNYVDEEASTLDSAYWSSAIANKIKINEISGAVPDYEDYKSADDGTVDPGSKTAVSVNDVFSLAEESSEEAINDTYGAFERLDNSSNFMSQETTVFNNINGKNVTVDTFVYHKNDLADNTNVGEGLLIYQALEYKRAHPDKDVSIDISSFRFSVEAGICINRDSRYFGYMRNLGKQNYDKYGFVSIAYLLVTAAKMGINVNVIGQIDAYPRTSGAPSFYNYFTSYLDEPCDPDYAEGVVGDYLDYNYCYWTSYGDDAATDMMHTKLCAVSNYIDINGNEHGDAIWLSSANLDGINPAGTNGNNNLQTGVIVSDHAQLYRVSSNYLKLIAEYCGQEDVYEFRDKANKLMTEQIDLINAGRGNEIAENEQIVYLGSDTDDVFEMYFSPFGGDAGNWDETYNPFCKYLRKLNNSDDYILFTWNNVKFNKNFALGDMFEKMIIQAFHNNQDPQNKIYVLLPGFDSAAFNDLTVGKTIGYKSFNKAEYGSVHNKDLQFSYSENGKREYVTLLDSMNLHQGAMSYQSNYALVIKEKDCSEDSVFFTVADLTTSGMVEHDWSDEVLIEEPSDTADGYKYHPCKYCDEREIIGVVHKSSDWITDVEGISHKECIFCGEILEVKQTSEESVLFETSSDGFGKTFESGNDKYIIDYNISSAPKTFEAVINLPKSVSGRGGVIIGNYSGKSEEQVSFEIFSNGRPRLYFSKDGKIGSYIFKTDIRGEKKHIAIAIDGDAAVLYVDGDKKETAKISDYITGLTTPLYLGGDARWNNEQYFKGTIYSAAMFNDCRTENEIKLDSLFVNKNEDNLIYLKNFGDASCPVQENAGHKESDWIIDSEFDGEHNGLKHIECELCGEVIKVCEFSEDSEQVTNLSHAAGLSFNKNSSLHEIPELISSDTLTIEADIKLDEGYSGRGGVIAGNYTGGSEGQINFEIYDNGKPRLYFVNGKYAYNYLFDTDVRTGEKLHLALVIEGRTASLYVNGEHVQSKTIAKTLPELSTKLVVGDDRRAMYRQYFKGNIYSVSIFDAVRAEEEIKRDSVWVTSDADGLIYSEYYNTDRSDSCSGHIAGEWIIDVEATDTTPEIRHTECTVCGEVLEVRQGAGAAVSDRTEYSGLSFASAEDRFVIDNSTDAVPKTIEAEICLPADFSDRAGVVVGNYGGSKDIFNLEIYSNGRPRLYLETSSDNYSYIFNTDIRGYSKVNMAVTFDSEYATLYINGNKAEQISVEAGLSNLQNNICIGGDNRSGNGQYFKGTIYSVNIFSDIRTEEEIMQDRVLVKSDTEGLIYSGYFK